MSWIPILDRICIILCIISLTGASLSSHECSPHALSSISYKLFEKKDVRCTTKTGPDELCDMRFLWPNSVTCIRPENKMPSPLTQRSPASEYALGAWRCESDRSWVQYANMICPENQTACETSVKECCHAEFDPSMALAYVLFLILGCALSFGCLCCVGLCGYIAHCMCSTYRNERRYVYSRFP